MFNILGIYSGAGPNLYPAMKMGWKVLANFEPRAGFHSGTWEQNFPDIPLFNDFDSIEQYKGMVDVLVAFPTCRFFSQAGYQWLTEEQRAKKRASFDELEKCAEVIDLLKPKIFFLENVQQLVKYYTFEAPGYDVQTLFIINGDYGNCQRRKRLWIVGTDGRLNFSFQPTIPIKKVSVRDKIGDLPFRDDIPELQHIHKLGTDKPSWIIKSIYDHDRVDTIAKLADYVLTFPVRKDIPYINRFGEQKRKLDFKRLDWGTDCIVIGTTENKFHPETGWPLTIRERARILGFPDNYLFTGPYKDQLAQTGACIPFEFPTYLFKLLEEQNK